MQKIIMTLLCVLLTNLPGSLYAAAGDISTFAGGGVGDSGPATSAPIDPGDVAVDAAGNIYIADFANNRIRKVDTSGTITTIAGNGLSGFTGDGGPATSAQLRQPQGLTIDSSGNIYIADNGNKRIRKIDTSGNITTIAGTGSTGFSGDGGLAVNATLNSPNDVALDSAGNLYIVDRNNDRIRKVDTGGIITTVAGNGVAGFSGDGGLATSASLDDPQGVVVDSTGNIYIADRNNHRIRKVDAITGNISTIAGDGVNAFSGDGGMATLASLNNPNKVDLDAAGNLYIADGTNRRIRKVDTSGIITTVAGGTPGFSGDGGTAVGAGIGFTAGVVFDTAGNFYIADASNKRIRKVDTGGIISTVAGNGFKTFFGEGSLATNASLSNPTDVIVDGAGNLIIADRNNNRIRKVDTNGIITTVAGNGLFSVIGDGGLAINARLNTPISIAMDTAGNLYIADSNHHRIRKVDTSGIITTVAGIGFSGYGGDGGPATSAELDKPEGVAVDAAGNIYISDTRNHVIRKVDTSGIITTITGNGFSGDSGDGGLAINAEIDNPIGLTVDSTGNLYFADAGNHRIRKIDTSGNITTFAGSTAGFSGDGGPATSARLVGPRDVMTDGAGNFYIADSNNVLIRKVDSSGVITTVAGSGTVGFSGDGSPAINASLNRPFGVVADGAGNIYIADIFNNRIRKVEAPLVPLTGSIKILKNVVGPDFSSMDFDFMFDSTAFAISENDTAGYEQTGLTTGTYSVVETVPSGWTLTSIDCGTGQNNTMITDGIDIVLEAGEDVVCTFNNTPPATGTNQVGDYVWEDTDGDGHQDSNENGLPGVIINLYQNCNTMAPSPSTLYGSTISDIDGLFGFSSLPDGHYQLEFVQPAGFSYSPYKAAGNHSRDSNANPNNNGFDVCLQSSGGDNRSARDAGFVPPAAAETLMLFKAIYYADDDRIWIQAGSDSPAGSSTLTATMVSGSTQTILGALPYKATKNTYQKNFSSVTAIPDSVIITSASGAMVTGPVEVRGDTGGGGGGGGSDTVNLLKAKYFPYTHKLWVKAKSDATPKGSANITVITVRNGQQTVLGELIWKANKNAYQKSFKQIWQEPDSVILISDQGGMATGGITY